LLPITVQDPARAGLRFLERFMTDLRIHDRSAQRQGSRP